MCDFLALASSRRSIRQYRDEPVSSEQIMRILRAGIWAPSAHNAQPWQFHVLSSAPLKERLDKAMGEAFRRDLEKDQEAPETIRSRVEASVQGFTTAPLLILACLTMKGMDMYPDERRQQAELVMGVQSVAAAIQNILLAIHAEGLGACWFCAPLFCQEVVRDTLGLSEELIPQAIITVGVPDEVPDPPPRESPEEKVKVYE